MSQAKGHDSVFELARPGSNDIFVLVPFIDWDEMIGILDVYFTEDPSSMQFVDHL
jgi:hypothetical protein